MLWQILAVGTLVWVDRRFVLQFCPGISTAHNPCFNTSVCNPSQACGIIWATMSPWGKNCLFDTLQCRFFQRGFYEFLLLKLSIQKWHSKSVLSKKVSKINKFWTEKITYILSTYYIYSNSTFLHGDSLGFVLMHYQCLNLILAFIVSHVTSTMLGLGI